MSRPAYLLRRACSLEVRSAKGTGFTASVLASTRFLRLAVMNTWHSKSRFLAAASVPMSGAVPSRARKKSVKSSSLIF